MSIERLHSRIMFELRWNEEEERWETYSPFDITYYSTTETKKAAIRDAAKQARQDPPSELIIKNKDGKIGKGSSSRRTYGADPERSRG